MTESGGVASTIVHESLPAVISTFPARSVAFERKAYVWPSTPVYMADVVEAVVTDTRPIGADTKTTPWIRITFSEGMDQASVEQAFSITPAIDGSFQWSPDSRTVTFVPTRELQSGMTYFVVIDSSARDLAGNSMVQSKTFQFATAPNLLGQFWWILLLVAAAIAGALFFLVRRRSQTGSKPSPAAPTAKESEAIVEDVFLLNHKDGLLIKHETRRLRPDGDMGLARVLTPYIKKLIQGGYT